MSNVIQGSLVADLGLETGLPTQVLDPFFSTWTPFQFLSWKAEVHRTKLSFLDPLMFLQCVCVCVCVCVCSVAQSCPALCDPMDCNPPGSSVHGISPARILEWVAISFSRGRTTWILKPKSSVKLFWVEIDGQRLDVSDKKWMCSVS